MTVDTLNSDVRKNSGETLILLDSNTIRLPAHIHSYKPPQSPASADEDYMDNINEPYKESYTQDEANGTADLPTVKMRVDIRVVKKDIPSTGISAPPSSPNNRPHVLNEKVNYVEDQTIPDYTEKTINGTTDLQPIHTKLFTRNRSAPASISQYRQKVLASSSQWVRRRAVLSEKPCVVLLRNKQQSPSVRPFSERERKEKFAFVDIKPAATSARVAGPEMGSFKGNNCLPNSAKRWKVKHNKKTSSPQQRTEEEDVITEETESNIVDKYVAELRNSLKASVIESRPVSFTDWTRAIKNKKFYGSRSMSVNDVESRLYEVTHKTHPQQHGSSFQSGNKKVRHEILSQISRASKSSSDVFLKVTGDAPPIRTPDARNLSLSQNARKGTDRYVTQFSRTSGVIMPAYVELKPVNRQMLRAHSFYELPHHNQRISHAYKVGNQYDGKHTR